MIVKKMYLPAAIVVGMVTPLTVHHEPETEAADRVTADVPVLVISNDTE